MNEQTEKTKPTKFQCWMLAIRPKTLPAAGSPVLVGAIAAWKAGHINWLAAIATLVCAIFLQILANLINDVGDYQKGTDKSTRLGPTRVTQSGLLTPKQVWTGIAVLGIVTLLIGVYLAWVGGWVIVIIGGLAMVCALLYTVSDFSFEDHGLGDLFAFIFFGPVAVCGAVYILTGTVPVYCWFAGAGVGALVTNILAVNNIRDMESDKIAGRHNIPVLYGKRGGEIEYAIMLVFGFLMPIIVVLSGWLSPWGLLPILGLPIGWVLLGRIKNTPPSKIYNKILADTAQLVLIYCLLFSIAIYLS